MKDNLFPLGLVTGQRFCNRHDERALLKHNIEVCQHTVITSPRRYGKSSLVHQVMMEMDVEHALVDLFVAQEDRIICERLMRGVSELVSKLLPFNKKALQVITDYFKNAQAVIRAGKIELDLSFAKPNFDPAVEILDLLEGLDALAKQKNKKVVIFMDEFQDIAEAKHSKAIQGAIRSVAQRTSHVVFIFSGSSRKMLSKIFDDRSQPLYMLCKKIFLERISAEHYVEYIQSAAETTWQERLPASIIDRILTLTERHSFYVNMLCSELWMKCGKKLPVDNDVNAAWSQCLEDESRRIETILESLTTNQLSLLRAIAQSNGVTEPTSQAFLSQINVPPGSVQRTVESLLTQDHLYRDKDDALKLVDPLLKTALAA